MPFPTSLTIGSKARLNNGVLMPVLGFGTWRLHGQETKASLKEALRTGYRLIDTASMYGNEVEVGEAVRESGVPRDELFITSKLWSYEHGHNEAKAACAGSLERLGMDHLDLYLIHWPAGGKNVQTWQGMLELLEEGKTRSIGVSNFSMEDVAPLVEATGVVPAVDQVELNPYHHDPQLLSECAKAGIQVEAYSPLNGTNLDDPVVVKLARSHRRTPAQIILRWCLQKGAVTLTRSSRPEHIRENAKVFDFELSPQETERLDDLG